MRKNYEEENKGDGEWEEEEWEDGKEVEEQEEEEHEEGKLKKRKGDKRRRNIQPETKENNVFIVPFRKVPFL